ncbi:MAG: winged helix-turn-helix domain-containing protein [Candidatus Bathyarchaeia archaeon]|nr:winged helix-turn-helix transcriptional regulator [Candidatus Bathyarchaeota archaeon]
MSRKELMREIQEIKTMLTAINISLKHFINQSAEISNQALLSHIRNDYVNAIENYLSSDVKEKLELKLTPKCEKREACKNILGDFLQKNVKLIRQERINDKVIEKMRGELHNLRREHALKDECHHCFDEAELLFEKQIQLLKSLNIYGDVEHEFQEIFKIPEEIVNNEILEPLANVKRLQILKSLLIKERTFSELMQITGLQGGNLLFHLQKLLSAGVIIQRHERGDYMITEKGYKILKSIAELYLDIANKAS